MTNLPTSATAVAPAKVNLALACGPVRDDGYHELVTVFQAVDLHEHVTCRHADADSVAVTGRQADMVPTDAANLALKAVAAMRRRHPFAGGIEVTIEKNVPVAGGMAGGSADAAATLVALDDLLGLELTRDELARLGATLGADVPFGVLGGTAVGRGRGDELTPVLTTGELHWVFAIAEGGLSTPDVFQELDRLRADEEVADPDVERALLAALRAGDAAAIGLLLTNDLERAAVSLRPELGDALAVGRAAGALGALVSGSGPTTAFLAADGAAALDISMALTAAGVCADTVRTHGPAHGARVVRREHH